MPSDRGPDFLAEAPKSNMGIKLLGGHALQRIPIDVVQSPPEDLSRAKELIGASR
jgi:hypothetical protein